MRFSKAWFAALAIAVSAAGFVSVGGVTPAVAQPATATSSVSGDAARAAINNSVTAGRITKETASKLTAAVNQGASVLIETGPNLVVLNQNIAAVAAAGGAAGFTGAQLAAGAFIAGAVVVGMSGGGSTTATTGTTGTTGTR